MWTINAAHHRVRRRHLFCRRREILRRFGADRRQDRENRRESHHRRADVQGRRWFGIALRGRCQRLRPEILRRARDRTRRIYRLVAVRRSPSAEMDDRIRLDRRTVCSRHPSAGRGARRRRCPPAAGPHPSV